MKKKSQQLPQEQQLDPNNPQQVQPGTEIQDQSGNDFVVVNQDDDQKVLMPKDQMGNQQIPQGMKSVDDNDLQTQYNIKQPLSASMRLTDSAIVRIAKRLLKLNS